MDPGGVGARRSGKVADGAELHPRISTGLHCRVLDRSWLEESIERDYVQIYRLLSGRQMDAGHETVKVKDAVAAVKRWFYGHEGRWLVVLDSADTIDNDRDKSYIDLRYFVPDVPGVHVIITSRR